MSWKSLWKPSDRRGGGSWRDALDEGYRELAVPRFAQPDDVTCGPTCLLEIYRYYGLQPTIEEVIAETPRNRDGGTLAVFLALGALARGLNVTCYSYNLRVFDPTWHALSPEELGRKLYQRSRCVRAGKLRRAHLAYRKFLRLGGVLRFDELTSDLVVGIIDRGRPVLTGLSATHLYRSPRERPDDMEADDVRGEPTGHFVVIGGYRGDGAEFSVRDPSIYAPFSQTGKYYVPAPRLINSILLGDLTYDAVLLEIWPKAKGEG